jgi:hypothetical protein
MKSTRPTRLTATFRARTSLSLALGAALLATAVPARGEEDVPLDTKIFRGVMESLGLKRADTEGINYQERGPLVIPPRLTLPPPEKTEGRLEKNPAWPKDPDVVKRKTIADMERNRNVSDEREREQNPLRPEQLTPGGKPVNPGRNRDEANSATPGDRLGPAELGSKGNIFTNMFSSRNDEVAKFTGENPRASLIEPPPGYQTPSPQQPYGLGKDAPAKAENSFITRSEPKN